MTQFIIDVVLDPSRAVRGSKRVDRALNNTERQALKLKRTMQGAFALIGITTLVTQLVRLSDTYTNMQNRLRLVTNSTRELTAVQKQLFNIADRTRSSLEATATIYSRTALSVRELGISHKETLNFVESLNHAIILSGVNSREASNGLIQLSQGIASNTLRGDELRAVLEQLPKVADVIAKSFGIARGELRLLGAQGKISGEDIIKAFKESAAELAALFKTTIPTIGQAFDVLTGRVVEGIGAFNEHTGAANLLATAMITLAHNLDLVAKGAVIAGSALALPFVRSGVNVAIAAVTALTAVIATNPLGAIAIGVIVAITALIQFSDQIEITSNKYALLSDALAVVVDLIKEEVDLAIFYIANLGNFIGDVLVHLFDELPASLRDFEFSFSGLLLFVARIMDGFVGLIRGSFDVLELLLVDSFNQMSNNIQRIFGSMANKVIEQINNIITNVNSLKDALGLEQISLIDLIEVPDARDETLFNNFGEKVGTAFVDGFNSSTMATDLLKRTLKGAESLFDDFNDRVRKKTIDRLITDADDLARARRAELALEDKPIVVDRTPVALKAQLALLDEELRILGLTNSERAIANKLLQITQRLRASNVVLEEGGDNEKLLIAAVRRNQAMKDQIALLKTITGQQDTLDQREKSLNASYDNGAIALGTLNEQLSLLAIRQAELNIDQGNGSFADGFLLGMEDMLASVRNFEAEAGATFADFFTGINEGFSDAIANSIIFGESLKETLGNVARQLLASLLSGLIQVGVQFLLNKVLGDQFTASQITGITSVGVTQTAIQATTTASSIAASKSTTAAIVSDNAIIASSAAVPAALESVVSFGGAAVAGLAALAAILGFVAAKNFADGGYVSGPGGPRSDSIAANLSNGEFVVNAKSTARFKPQLEAINSGRGFADGGEVTAPSQSSSSSSEAPVSSGGQFRIINILDPKLVGDFLSSQDGQEVLINVISENSDSLRAILN